MEKARVHGLQRCWPATRGYGLTETGAAVVELVLDHFSTESVTVNAEDFRGARLIAIGAVEDAPDETFLEFPDSLVEEDSAVDHLQYQTF